MDVEDYLLIATGVIFVIAILIVILQPTQKVKDHCDSDDECKKDEVCLYNPDYNKKMCTLKGRQYCELDIKSLISCDSSAEGSCLTCDNEPSWSCQTTLGKKCDKKNVCSDGETCEKIQDEYRCSKNIQWTKTEDKGPCSVESDCTKFGNNTFCETGGRCIKYNKFTLPQSILESVPGKDGKSVVCALDSDCTKFGGNICIEKKCMKQMGWCAPPFKTGSGTCNRFTGTDILVETTNDSGQKEYQWSCACDTNVFSNTTSGDCTLLKQCSGAEKKEGGMYLAPCVYERKGTIDTTPRECSTDTDCTTDPAANVSGVTKSNSRCVKQDEKGVCYCQWGSDTQNGTLNKKQAELIQAHRNPYPSTNDEEDQTGGLCNCRDIATFESIQQSPGEDSKRWALYCTSEGICAESGGKLDGATCECTKPGLINCGSVNPSCTDSCVEDPCLPGKMVTTSTGSHCSCPTNCTDISSPELCSKLLDPSRNSMCTWNDDKCTRNENTYKWNFWKAGDENYYKGYDTKSCVAFCGPEHNPCGGQGNCNVSIDDMDKTDVSCLPCECGFDGDYCQTMTNVLPPGYLCSYDPCVGYTEEKECVNSTAWGLQVCAWDSANKICMTDYSGSYALPPNLMPKEKRVTAYNTCASKKKQKECEAILGCEWADGKCNSDPAHFGDACCGNCLAGYLDKTRFPDPKTKFVDYGSKSARNYVGLCHPACNSDKDCSGKNICLEMVLNPLAGKADSMRPVVVTKKCCDNDDDDYPNCDSENTIKCRKGKICVDPCFKSSTCNDNYPLT